MVQTDFYYFIASGFVLMLLPFIIIGGFWMRGFFFPFMRVKASGGSKVLVRAWNLTHFVFIPGTIVEGNLVFKYGKDTYRHSAADADFYRMLKIAWVDYDLITKKTIRRDGSAGTAHDPVKFDSLLTRAMMRPGERDKLVLAAVILLVVVLLIQLAQAGMLAKVYQLLQVGARAATSTGVVPA